VSTEDLEFVSGHVIVRSTRCAFALLRFWRVRFTHSEIGFDESWVRKLYNENPDSHRIHLSLD